jgi:hypothetical protein
MGFGRSIKIAFVLAVGITLGYAVRPSAQAIQGPPVLFLVESAGPDLVRVYLSSGGAEFVEDRNIVLHALREGITVEGSEDMTIRERDGVLLSVAETKSGSGRVSKTFKVITH